MLLSSSMIQSKQGTYYCADYLIGGSGSISEDRARAMIETQGWLGGGMQGVAEASEAQMKPIYESLQADTSMATPLMNKPLTDPSEMNNYNGLIEIGGLSYSAQYAGFMNERLDMPALLNHWTPEDEAISTLKSMNMDWQQSEHSFVFNHQAVSNKNVNDDPGKSHAKNAASGSSPNTSRSLSRKPRQRSKEVESHRRFIVAERLRALQELLPGTLKVNQDSVQSNRESVLDNAIGYIKHLQLQLKGHGHYYSHKKLFEEPLEEVFGGLIEENLEAACKLLESKGLHMVPIASMDALWKVQ